MNLTYSKEDNQFRQTIREFIKNNLPKDISAKVADGKRIEKSDIVVGNKFSINKAGEL